MLTNSIEQILAAAKPCYWNFTVTVAVRASSLKESNSFFGDTFIHLLQEEEEEEEEGTKVGYYFLFLFPYLSTITERFKICISHSKCKIVFFCLFVMSPFPLLIIYCVTDTTKCSRSFLLT